MPAPGLQVQANASGLEHPGWMLVLPNGDGRANGRPVGVALDRTGALLVADDVGAGIWRVSGRR